MIVAKRLNFGLLVVDEQSGHVVADFGDVEFPSPEEIASHRWFRGNGLFRFAVWGIAPDAQSKLLERLKGGEVIRVSDLGSHPPLHVVVAVARSEEDAMSALKWLRGLGYCAMPVQPGAEDDAPRLPGWRPLRF